MRGSYYQILNLSFSFVENSVNTDQAFLGSNLIEKCDDYDAADMVEESVGDVEHTVGMPTLTNSQRGLLIKTVDRESENTAVNVHTAVLESSQITCASESKCLPSSSALVASQQQAEDPSPVTAPSPCATTADLPPRFLFGGGDEEQFITARRIVELLGGTVVWPVESAFDESCTHLVLWKMTRTEKYLCACAAGKVSLPLPHSVIHTLLYTLSPLVSTLSFYEEIVGMISYLSGYLHFHFLL